jgi:POT family proton-dependent oligopeptide transporter
MSINIGSTLGFLICSYLGEKIGWHWGFGAAGIGMTFGVIQYIKHRHLLGDAGMHPNEMEDDKRKKLTNYLKISLVGMFMVIGAGLFGFFTIDPRFFAEQFAYFLTIIAGLYFVYLFLFAGLNAAERKNLILLFLLFIGAAAFWSGFDQSAGSLKYFCKRLYRFINCRIRDSGWMASVCKSSYCCFICSNLCGDLGSIS